MFLYFKASLEVHRNLTYYRRQFPVSKNLEESLSYQRQTRRDMAGSRTSLILRAIVSESSR
jgi:hypothetical protein